MKSVPDLYMNILDKKTHPDVTIFCSNFDLDKKANSMSITRKNLQKESVFFSFFYNTHNHN